MSRVGGNEAEDRAAGALIADGYEILDRNFSCRVGEIDIVAKKDDYICFVEVKYRNPRGYGTAIDAITHSKMHKILMTAKNYLFSKNMSDADYRIDAVVIDGKAIEIMPNIYMEGM
jgi:putative endonuclease